MNRLKLSKVQSYSLVFLRVLIGWHFLYEGLVKIMDPNWTSAGFLNSSQWIFSDLFITIASNPLTLSVADLLNEWGLTIIGLFLILGLFTRISGFLGAFLLLLYYLAMPPLVGLQYSVPMEGSYLVINKTLIEAAALIVVAVIANGDILGLDVFVQKIQNKKK